MESENSNTFIFNDHPHMEEKLPAISLKTLMARGWGVGVAGGSDGAGATLIRDEWMREGALLCAFA